MSRRPYVRPMPGNWFMKHPAYRFYMLRESSCVFNLLYCINLLNGLFKLAAGPDAWNAWMTMQGNPLMVVFALVTLGLTLIHTITFANMAPRVAPQQVRKAVGDMPIRNGLLGGVVVVNIVIIALAAMGGTA
ncbi:fumarate reductase subunit C [Sansalvadorimonas verongulae]|uniref:fumarate reductase subunit C n=1 Tax=Sansalvadorimonas verongulae TaxID=2172824 RepID=UPI0012BC8FD6|nr:fumarate reductase subunit C [Sansalvadorimonas verongulae]MTI13276.1 fumarate reductase subunit C [Sansalvadorimonas verongulae]